MPINLSEIINNFGAISFYNGRSGSSRSEQIARAVSSRLRITNVNPITDLDNNPDLLNEFGVVIAAGGDGTIASIAGKILGSNSHAILGVINSGTYNLQHLALTKNGALVNANIFNQGCNLATIDYLDYAKILDLERKTCSNFGIMATNYSPLVAWSRKLESKRRQNGQLKTQLASHVDFVRNFIDKGGLKYQSFHISPNFTPLVVNKDFKGNICRLEIQAKKKSELFAKLMFLGLHYLVGLPASGNWFQTSVAKEFDLFNDVNLVCDGEYVQISPLSKVVSAGKVKAFAVHL